jgi:gephyrin
VIGPHNHPLHEPIPEGAVYRTNTGTQLPAGADAVLMVEDTRLISTMTTEDGEEEEEFIETLAQILPKENVRSPGSDVMKGEKVMERGEIIASTGGEVGTLTFVAKKQVSDPILY